MEERNVQLLVKSLPTIQEVADESRHNFNHRTICAILHILRCYMRYNFVQSDLILE